MIVFQRFIIDGPGSRTVFNGLEALRDLLYTRANRMISGKEKVSTSAATLSKLAY